MAGHFLAACYLEIGENGGNPSLEDGVLLTTGAPESAGTELAADLAAAVFEDDRSQSSARVGWISEA